MTSTASMDQQHEALLRSWGAFADELPGGPEHESAVSDRVGTLLHAEPNASPERVEELRRLVVADLDRRIPRRRKNQPWRDCCHGCGGR